MPQFHSRFTLPFGYADATNIVFHNGGVVDRSSHMKATGQLAALPKYDTSATRVEMKLEVEIIPVSDVERSKRFYKRLGWRFDDDVSPFDGVRIVQFTPPGSACSVTFGKGITAAAPGSAEVHWSSPTSKRPMTILQAAASTRVTCGTVPRSRARRGNPAPIRSVPATGRSYPLTIPTATRG